MDITAFFSNPSAWGIGLAVIFGIVWTASLKPSGLRRPTFWIVLLAGAVLFAPAIAWIQSPLQSQVGTAIIKAMGLPSYQNELLWAGIPVILLSGLVQEGAKLLPVVAFWLFKHRELDPQSALIIGAVTGVGFGVFEAQWVLNGVFASGWSWANFQAYGFIGIAAFPERFFTVAFHTASTALAGWGLARGKGWQFYLLASFLHFIVNYGVILSAKDVFTSAQVEIYVYVVAALVFSAVLWLRYKPSIKENE